MAHERRSLRIRLALRAWVPCGPSARVASPTKSRKIPPGKHSGLFPFQEDVIAITCPVPTERLSSTRRKSVSNQRSGPSEQESSECTDRFDAFVLLVLLLFVLLVVVLLAVLLAVAVLACLRKRPPGIRKPSERACELVER